MPIDGIIYYLPIRPIFISFHLFQRSFGFQPINVPTARPHVFRSELIEIHNHTPGATLSLMQKCPKLD
jgi:hypothetical protein